MSRALRGLQIGRTCLAHLRSGTDSPFQITCANLVPPAAIQERLWLPPWPGTAADRGGAGSVSQRTFASGPEDGSGRKGPSSSTAQDGSSDATPAERPQPSQPQNTSGYSSPGHGPTPGPEPVSASADGAAGNRGGTAASDRQPPYGAAPPRDVPRENMTSVVVPSDRLEHEADALLDAWEPLMAQVWVV